MTLLARRSFLTGLASALAAPAIVRAGSLMPVKALKPELVYGWELNINTDTLLVKGYERYSQAWVDVRTFSMTDLVELKCSTARMIELQRDANEKRLVEIFNGTRPWQKELG